jgi:hypothetical protein
MKRTLQWIVAIVLLGSLTIQADPFKTWNWTDPAEYENGSIIPETDDLSFRLKCGTTLGGPYDLYETLLTEPAPSVQDMGPLVSNTPGTYYCIATATSSLHNTESAPSNEVNFTVLPGDLGLRPKPPVLSLGSG